MTQNNNNENKILKKLPDITVIFLFLFLVFGITVWCLLTPDKERSESENRTLAQRPDFTFSSLFAKKDADRFTTKYEKYLTDQFAARDSWIGIKTRFELLLGKTDINGVYFAKDDYLITKNPKSSVKQSTAELNIKALCTFITNTESSLGKGHVSVMMPPTAADILSEKLPPFTSDYDQKAFLDRIYDSVKDVLIDVRPVLLSHKDEYIYYRTDHHWTALGAYYAYTIWAEKEGLPVKTWDISDVSTDFYGTLYSKVNLPMKPDTVTLYTDNSSFRVVYDSNASSATDSLFSMSRLNEKDKYMVYLDGNHAIVEITNQSAEKNGKNLLVIKDSYAHTFVPFIAAEYDTVTMIDFRYCKLPVSKVMSEHDITDVLILYNLPNFAIDENVYLLNK